MSDHEAISACSSPATFVETNCPTDVSLDISVKIERIQSDNEEISDTETFIIPYEEPDVMTWLSDDSSLCRRKLQVKLTRLPTFLLKLFIKEPDRNNGLNSEPTSLLIAEGCNSDSEQLSDPELASIVFKSKFKSAMSRLLSSAFQQKPVNKEGSPSNNDFNCKANGTSETNHIAPDTDSTMALRNENNNFPTKISKISTDYYTLETCPAKEYKCSMCKYITNRERVMKTHIQAHSAARQYICDTCSYITTRRLIFEHHISMHKGVKPHACDKCKKRFLLTCDLYRHLRTHTSEKPFVCHICFKKFSQQRYLKVHSNFHKDKKPHACEKCDKKFTLRSNLNLHMRSHSGVKPYACKICGKRFSRKGILNNHIRIHTQEKPYVCNMCDRKYSDQGNFRKHIVAHSKGPIRSYTHKRFKEELSIRKEPLRCYTNKHLKPEKCD